MKKRKEEEEHSLGFKAEDDRKEWVLNLLRIFRMICGYFTYLRKLAHVAHNGTKE